MIRVALIGNPNVGKSTLFNLLTGMHQHTGNWTGKTVGCAVGYKEYKNQKFEIYDLPGTYSLIPHSEEEKVTSDFVIGREYDLALIVCDPMCITRNLNLVIQTLQVTKNVVVCINLLDEARKNDVSIDLEKLSTLIKTPVVGISAKNNYGIDELLDKMIEGKKSTYVKEYEDKIEDCINIVLEHTNSKFEAIYTIINNDSSNEKISDKLKLINNYLYENNINFSDNIMMSIISECESIHNKVIKTNKDKRKRNLDRILTNKITGIPIMILMLMIILWISIIGANYPSDLLFDLFNNVGDKLRTMFININCPKFIYLPFMDGIYRVLTWVISVMLPPMVIFFPLFTLLEDYGILPRIAFNLDGYFEKSGTCGKQALTMCMGVGCNAVGVVGSRIIDSKRERLISIITNSFIPCNGRFPSLILLLTILLPSNSSLLSKTLNVLLLTIILIISVIITLLVSKILSRTILKGKNSFFILELPPYRKPDVIKILVRSLIDRTLKILIRAIIICIPAGLIIYLLTNINVGGITLLKHVTHFFNSFGLLIGLDGVIITSFILGFPANEIVIPIMLMSYLSSSTIINISNIQYIKNILIENNWNIITIICMIIFILFHFPCSTTLTTIYKETKSKKWTILSFIIPLIVGITLCFIINIIGKILI